MDIIRKNNFGNYILQKIIYFSGYCRDVNVRASVEIVGTQQVVFDVDSKDLHPLEEFTVDVAVCLGKLIAEKIMPRNGKFPYF